MRKFFGGYRVLALIAIILLAVLQVSTAPPRTISTYASSTHALPTAQTTTGTFTGDSGDIKISQNPQPTTGVQGDDPHVQCQFYILGFNLAASQGLISIASWPPTGDGTIVLSGTYTGVPTSSGRYQSLSGPYTLPVGHYKVFVTDNMGTAIDKQKVLWVDPCALPPTSTPTPQAPTDTPTPQVPTDTPTVGFPGGGA